MRAVGGFSAIAPIFPQQSIREMTRTGRTPIEVMDDATWGMFAEGWRDGTGADADHLKTTADIDACLAVGFSMFTIDPSEHVDSSADTADLATLRAKVAALPWADLADTEESLRKRFLGQSFAVEHLKVAFDEAVLLRAAAKYGKAVAHVAKMSRHLAEGRRRDAGRARGLGGRDRHPDLAGRALLGGLRAASASASPGSASPPASSAASRRASTTSATSRSSRRTWPPTPRSPGTSARTS